jgi:hypothetical protein
LSIPNTLVLRRAFDLPPVLQGGPHAICVIRKSRIAISRCLMHSFMGLVKLWFSMAYLPHIFCRSDSCRGCSAAIIRTHPKFNHTLIFLLENSSSSFTSSFAINDNISNKWIKNKLSNNPNREEIDTLSPVWLPICCVLLGNNTLQTSKLGLDLHADHDLKEITFNLSPQNSNPFFLIQAWKGPTNLFTDVWCRSFVALCPLAYAAPSKDNPAIKTKHYACMLFFYLRVRD